ncbi:MAG: MAPEG family protein [Alphaproteobacteria bacterium]
MELLILAALGLYLVQTLLPPAFRYFLRPDADLSVPMGPRDNPPETSVYGARSERAHANMQEALLIFLPLALLLNARPEIPAMGLLGAQIFVIARLIYLPAYITGIPVVRSLVWTVGLVALFLMAGAVAGSFMGASAA